MTHQCPYSRPWPPINSLLLCLIAAAFVLLAASQAHAQDDIERERVVAGIEPKLRVARHMAFHPTIVRAVIRQNNEQLSPDEIQQRDEEWRSAEGQNALQRRILQNEASQVLKTFIERNADFNEAFATDNQGANVAMFPVTSDYWQGDEEKWQKPFNEDRDEAYIGEMELDESTDTVAVQVSIPVLNRGEKVGILVLGVTQNYLQQ